MTCLRHKVPPRTPPPVLLNLSKRSDATVSKQKPRLRTDEVVDTMEQTQNSWEAPHPQARGDLPWDCGHPPFTHPGDGPGGRGAALPGVRLVCPLFSAVSCAGHQARGAFRSQRSPSGLWPPPTSAAAGNHFLPPVCLAVGVCTE